MAFTAAPLLQQTTLFPNPQTAQLFTPSLGMGIPGLQQPSFDTSSLQMLVGSLLQLLQNSAQGGMPSMPSFGSSGGATPLDSLGGFLGGGGSGIGQVGGGNGPARRPRRARRQSQGGGTGGSGGGGTGSAAGSSSGSRGTGQTGASPGVSAGLNNNQVKGLTFAEAANLVKKGGGEVNPGGRPTVLALRSDTSASSQYKDVFVVLKPDGTLDQFDGSTRPTSNGKDRAMLKPGAYEISPRWRDGKYNNDAFLVQTKKGSNTVGVGRDSNGDGKWSKAEMNAGTSSDLIRLHRGNGNSTSSTGCLNVKDYDGFLKSVGGRDSNFNLVVVNQK